METRVLESPLARSITIHILFFIVAFFYVTQGPRLALREDPIEVSVEEETKESKTQKTIVKRSAGQEEKTPAKKAYLSDRTRLVQEERSSRNDGDYSGATQSGEISKPNKPKISLSDFGIKLKPKTQDDFLSDRNWAKTPLGETLRGGQYIQGMKEGEFSALNTKEFVFYSYFERVRKQLDQAWQPLLRENVHRLLKSGRHLASNSDFVTRALVTMNQRGEIQRIQILEESGTQDLDQAAIDALNKAGPYPNPPKGLIDSSGRVEIRWDFILKT